VAADGCLNRKGFLFTSGYRVDLGLGQITDRNLPALGYTTGQVLGTDPAVLGFILVVSCGFAIFSLVSWILLHSHNAMLFFFASLGCAAKRQIRSPWRHRVC
jgi:hypothetical protein